MTALISARPRRAGGPPRCPPLPPIKPARSRRACSCSPRLARLPPDSRAFRFVVYFFPFHLAATAAVLPSEPPRPAAGPGPAGCARRGSPAVRRGARRGAVLAGSRRGHPGRLLRSLLLCLCLPSGSLAGLLMTTTWDANHTQENALTRLQPELKSSPEPTTTAETVSQTTWGSISDHLTLEHDASTAGPDLTTSDFNEVINLNKSQPLYVEYEVLLPGIYMPLPDEVEFKYSMGVPSSASIGQCSLLGETGVSIEKNITLGSAVKIELSCRLADKYSSMKILRVTWKKGNETIKHIRKTANSWSIQLTISENWKLGSYTCAVKGEREFSVVFRLQVPQIEGREKPVISYEGDSAILICKSHSYTPIAWTWYMTNGSEQIAINDSLMLDKYVIDKANPNVTHLKILKLTKEDDGAYWCEAAFELGRSKGKLKLSILSLMVPLKPFLAIVAEVIILITVIFVFELYSKKKEKRAEAEKECDQIEQLKSEDSNGVENTSARHRRI